MLSWHANKDTRGEMITDFSTNPQAMVQLCRKPTKIAPFAWVFYFYEPCYFRLNDAGAALMMRFERTAAMVSYGDVISSSERIEIVQLPVCDTSSICIDVEQSPTT